MYRLLYILLFAVSFSACSLYESRGDLVAEASLAWYEVDPVGMEKIPSGSYTMGNTASDLVGDDDAPIKTVSVRGFYMDNTEITNAEYKVFVDWTRDRILRVALAERAQELLDEMTWEEKGAILKGVRFGTEKSIFNFSYLDADTAYLDEHDRFLLEQRGDYHPHKINWSNKLFYYDDASGTKLPDMEYAQVLEQFMVLDSITGDYIFNQDEIIYRNKAVKFGRLSDMPEEVAIYPDVTVWETDFEYSYNEPLQENYFLHEAYNGYPVVGVTWDQARAFCDFRTVKKNTFIKKNGQRDLPRFRLPTETEWEYAARGGIDGAMFPWGGPFLTDPRGCFLANFKPQRGDYGADGTLYTSDARTYRRNGYNLYGMSGNVAEWTATHYKPSSYNISSTMNPTIGGSDTDKRVIRGGSWKDVAYFLRVNVRDYEHKNIPRSYIGFRTIRDLVKDKNY